jgi:hypothetical protein
MSTQRVLYGVENSNYSAYKSEICYLTFDKKDANLHAECMTGDYQSRDHHDDLVNNDSDLYSSVFNYDFGGGTALINVIKFDLADLSRYPVGTDDYMKYIHNPENGERPTTISIDSHLERDTTKSTLRKFLEENGIVISKRFNLDAAKFTKRDMIMAIIDLMKFESKANIIEKLKAIQNKPIEVFDRKIFISKTVRATAKCILTDEKFQTGELRVGFNVINFREPNKMMTKWCKYDAFFNVPKHQLMELVKRRKLCKESINIIVPTTIENLMFDDKPALTSLSQSEIEQVKLSLLEYHNINDSSKNVDVVDIKRSYDGGDGEENDENVVENVSKKRCLESI